MDCRMEENGVTPIPVATKTACSARNILEAGAPNGPSKRRHVAHVQFHLYI